MVTQLDIFTALAEEAAAEAELTGFTVSDEHTPEVLLEAFELWKEAHGSRGAWARSRMWKPGLSNVHTGAHPWTKMDADLRPCGWKDGAEGPSYIVSRVYCWDCQWWTPIRTGGAGGAMVDYLDHCWPGWRELPPIPFRKSRGLSAPKPSELPDDYPEAWQTPGAPSINYTDPRFTTPRDNRLVIVGGRSPFGGPAVSAHPAIDYPTLTRVTKEAA